METTLNNRWATVAAQVKEDPTDRRNKQIVRTMTAPMPHPPTVPRETALAVAGLSREEVLRLTAKARLNVTPADKQGAQATEQGNVISIWIGVTPSMATRWLKTNFVNRPVSGDTVAAYARDMVMSRWQSTHQGIAFNDRDELIDGQHRLMAVIQANVTVRMMVTFGLPAKIAGSEMTTMDCVDRGRTRSVADQLKIQHGLKNGSLVASLSSSIAHLCVGERHARRLSVGHTLDIYRAFQNGIDYVIEHRTKKAGLKSAGVLGAFAFVFEVDESVAQSFLDLNGGTGTTPAMEWLHEFLTGEQSSMLLATMSRGVAELTTHVLWLDSQSLEPDLLVLKPDAWAKSIEHYRGLQAERVAKVANLFKLPEGK